VPSCLHVLKLCGVNPWTSGAERRARKQGEGDSVRCTKRSQPDPAVQERYSRARPPRGPETSDAKTR